MLGCPPSLVESPLLITTNKIRTFYCELHPHPLNFNNPVVPGGRVKSSKGRHMREACP